MRRNIIIGFLLATILAPLAAQASPVTEARQATVTVQGEVHTPNGVQYAMGAGVVVADTVRGLTILTAFHVVNHPNILVRTHDGLTLAVASVQRIGTRDQALITTDAPPFGHLYRPVTVAKLDHTPAFTWGTPLGKQWTEALLTPSTLRIPPGESAGVFGFTCGTCAEGDSGGGVFNAEGELLGTLTAGYTNNAGQVVLVVAEPAPLL